MAQSSNFLRLCSDQVGVIEGPMTWCGIEGTITAVRSSPCGADLTIAWRTGAN